MSSDSVVGKAWHGVSHFFQDPFNMIPDPGQPDAPPPPPNPGAATQAALQGQLKNEVQLRASMANVTGGEGVADQPTTAGTMLLGGN